VPGEIEAVGYIDTIRFRSLELLLHDNACNLSSSNFPSIESVLICSSGGAILRSGFE